MVGGFIIFIPFPPVLLLVYEIVAHKGTFNYNVEKLYLLDNLEVL